MSRKKDDTKVDLRGGIGIAEIIDFKDAKNSGEDSARADLNGGTGAKKMVNFRSIEILNDINVDRFSSKSIALDIGLFDDK